MSVLEDRAKPFVLPLVRGQSVTLTDKHQLYVAEWITLVAMVGEYFTPKGIILPQEIRTAFMRNQKPSEAFRIWIGDYVGTDRPFSVRKQRLAIRRKPGPNAHRSLATVFDKRVGGIDGPNFVTLTFSVGPLYAHFFAGLLPEWVDLYSLTLKDGPLQRLWPPRRGWFGTKGLRWPPKEKLEEEAAQTLKSWLNQFMGAESQNYRHNYTFQV
ncbi:MAG: hypothetical protein JOY77_07540 [Alphaproteobacteria bacterium]|nr:hypothetical protein [Alphaproteobacteria bacterium]